MNELESLQLEYNKMSDIADFTAHELREKCDLVSRITHYFTLADKYQSMTWTERVELLDKCGLERVGEKLRVKVVADAT